MPSHVTKRRKDGKPVMLHAQADGANPSKSYTKKPDSDSEFQVSSDRGLIPFMALKPRCRGSVHGCPAHSNRFQAGPGTGLMGSTEPGQRVTKENAGELPGGSVVRLGDGSRLIRLDGDMWLWCCDSGWCYDRIENLAWRIDSKAVACHVAGGSGWLG